MKKITAFICLLVSLVAYSQFSGPGYYRVHNVCSDSYICIKGTEYTTTTNPDAFWSCIRMLKNENQEYLYDPGSIIYIPGWDQVSLYAQGVDTYSLTGYLMDIVDREAPENGNPTYLAKTRYYYHGYLLTCYFRDYGNGLTAGSSNKYDESHWWIEPVNAGSIDTSYLCVKPVSELSTDVKEYYWATICCDFPFMLPEDGGVEGAYTINEVTQNEDGTYCAKPVKVFGQGETVTASMPVLLKCKSGDAKGNRIIPVGEIANNTELPVKNDMLMGNYFSNFFNHADMIDHSLMQEYIPKKSTKASGEYLALGVDADGKLGFFPQAEGTYMAANTAWLSLAGLGLDGVDAVYLVMETESEPEPDPVIPGDINGDDKLNVTDISLLINVVLTYNEEEPTKAADSDDFLKACDVNCDGHISITDVSMLISIVLNSPDETDQ